jgi:DNA-binding NarL/FixJ family response regulator
MAYDIGEKRQVIAAIVLFATIFVFIALDLVIDWNEGVSLAHVAIECVVLLAAAGGAVTLWRQLQTTRSGLVAARAEAHQWRRESEELLAGLSVAIQRQLESWEATPAETEVAIFLLKGMSFREIAAARGTSERTTREQARAVYRKSGLGNRAELSAFFLEDLLPPRADPGP